MYMYELKSYCRMSADEVRLQAYSKSLEKVIKPDSVVLDLGAGAGFFAVLACKLGARKVYAIEYNDTIELGPQLAAANGCSDRIEFIQDLSTRVNLPEKVDVIVSDLRGSSPLYFGSVASLIDARERFLKPGGIMIQQRDTIFAALVEAFDVYDKNVTSLIETRAEVDQSMYRKFLCNQLIKGRVERTALLTEPQIWATLHYPTISSPHVTAELRWKALHDGIAHGLSLWFEAELGIDADARVSTAPFEPERIWGTPFFALQEPIALVAGDEITVNLSARLVDKEYVWRWDTRVIGGDSAVKADFKQSTFYGEIISLSHMRKQAATFVPALTEEGQINAFILAQMNGQTSLQAIAKRLSEQFPLLFPTWEKAMKSVGDVAGKFSQ